MDDNTVIISSGQYWVVFNSIFSPRTASLISPKQSVCFEGRMLLPNVGKYLDSSWNVMAHGDAREGKWRGNRRMEWVASTLHTASEHGVSSITTADAHTSAASSRPNWRPCRFKWTRPFRQKTKPGFCACAITFQLAFTNGHGDPRRLNPGDGEILCTSPVLPWGPPYLLYGGYRLSFPAPKWSGRHVNYPHPSRCTSTPAPALTLSSLWCDSQIPTAHRTNP